MLICVFLVLFQRQFLSEVAGELLIAFLNILLVAFNAGFRLPKKISTLRNHAGIATHMDGLKSYAACQKCHKIYRLTDMLQQDQVLCSHIEFPDHPHRQRATATCDEPVLKQSANGLIPFKEFSYHSIVFGLRMMFKRKNFLERINAWRQRSALQGTLFDVYDGRMWQELKDQNGNTFVDDRSSLLLTLNVDWFNPNSKGPSYSVGAMYLSINNLPRSERYKPENILLCGTIPGPDEPSKSQMNFYLRPLVKELKKLYVGVPLEEGDDTGPKFRAALLIVACDMPAARKVSGFVGLRGFRGCYKCDHHFETLPGTTARNWAFFDVERHVHSEADSMTAARRWMRATTAGERTTVEQETGCLWTELCHLQYFSRVRCTVVDPMHNLFLGTAKRMVELWQRLTNPDTGDYFLTPAHFHEMKLQLDGMDLPPGYELSARKIGQRCAFMTAAEWRVFTLVSPLLLKGRLPRSHLDIWLLFVDANRILARPSIHVSEVQQAHNLLRAFCLAVSEMYGDQEITPNMHTHLHLATTILDFGPVHSYWLFSFERYNGIVKSIATNHKDRFENTFMQTFLEMTFAEAFISNSGLDTANYPEVIDVFKKLVPSIEPPVIDITNQVNDVFDLNAFIGLAENLGDTAVTGSSYLPPSTYPSIKIRDATEHIQRDHYIQLCRFYRDIYVAQDFWSLGICCVDRCFHNYMLII